MTRGRGIKIQRIPTSVPFPLFGFPSWGVFNMQSRKEDGSPRCMRLTPLSRRIIIPLRFSPVKTFTAYWRILNRESAWTLWSRCWNYVAGSSKCVWEGGRCARRMRNGFENVRRRRTKSDNKNLIFRNANEYFYFRYFACSSTLHVCVFRIFL